MPGTSAAKAVDTPKITLRVGQKSNDKSSEALVDHEALKSQQDLVKSGSNGHLDAVTNGVSSRPNSRTPVANAGSGTGAANVPTTNNATQDQRSGSAASPGSSNGVKSETQPAKSPALAPGMLRKGSSTSNEATQSPSLAATSMPPPASITPRLPSGSPHPQAIHTSQIYQPTNPLDTRWRQPGKSMELLIPFLPGLANSFRRI